MVNQYSYIKRTFGNLGVGEDINDSCPFCDHNQAFSIRRVPTHLIYHCFRCKETGSVRMTEPTLRERKLYEDMMRDDKPPVIPDDYTKVLPQDALVLMLKYGLKADILNSYNIGYSEKLGMLIYPVYYKGKLEAVQHRLLYDNPNLPKYITHGHKAPYLCGKESSRLILTEDILSAIKLSKYCKTLCLMGTKLSIEHKMEIIRGKYKEVVIWLDNDKAGIDGRNEIKRQLSFYGIDVKYIVSEQDPKAEWYSTIENKLGIEHCD